MKIFKDILIFIWLLIFTVLLGIVCCYALKRLTEDKNTSAQVDANQYEQISQLNAKIDSLENMIMRGQEPKNASAQVDANQRELKSQLRLENDDLKKSIEKSTGFHGKAD